MLESSYGKSKLSKEGNNHFGIKCHRDNWQGGEMYMADDRPDECFRTYPTPLQSFQDHSRFLEKGQRYSELFKLKPNDYKSWAEGLKEAGYATNPRYDELLVKLIKEHNLHYFDQFHNKPYEGGKLAADRQEASDQDSRIGEQNSLRAYQLSGDESLKEVARQTGTSMGKLKTYNDFQDPYATIDKALPLYLEPKKDKPARSYHVVEEQESLWDIAQQYGVKVKKLYKRNRLQPPAQPPVGARIFLRKVRYDNLAERKEPLPEPDQSSATVNKTTHKRSEERPRYHAVQPGETMADIAQRYNIAADKLYKMNRLSRDQQPAVGAEIHLKETRYIKPEVRETPVKTTQSEAELPARPEKPEGPTVEAEDQPASKSRDDSLTDQKPEASSTEPEKPTQDTLSKPADDPNGKAETDSRTASATKAEPSSAANSKQHSVKAGETLYQIATQYDVTVEQLKQWNKLDNATIQKGQTLRVAAPADDPKSHDGADSQAQASAGQQGAVYHTVAEGETLYSIAREYNLSTDQLKARNDLTSNQLTPGQQLKIESNGKNDPEEEQARKANNPDQVRTHTVKKGETLYSIAQEYDTSVEVIKKSNDLDEPTLDPGQELLVPRNQ
jgi:LysM repeat protein